jgi:hypothetical protein
MNILTYHSPTSFAADDMPAHHFPLVGALLAAIAVANVLSVVGMLLAA